MRIPAFIIIALCLMLLGCDARHRDVRLDAVADIAGQDPLGALQSLDSIDYAALSESDRHFYDFLSIKAKDKAYIMHSSDSLILDVINWYGNHRKSNLYPETLYYGGRVYSDIGDYPSALRYFHMALDELPENTDNPKLRATVLSQTGRLLNLLRLYKEAEPYIERSIELDLILGDTVNVVNDLQLLGSIQLRAGRYDDAEKSFLGSLDLSNNLPDVFRINSNMYLSAVHLYKGDIDAGLKLIRNIPESVEYANQNCAYAYAANIYMKAGIIDTAYYYARALINSKYDSNKHAGYHVLLSPELNRIVVADSLVRYVKDYNELLEKRYNENENQLALNQQAYYNYHKHKREREKAEESQKIMRNWTIFLFCIIIVIIFLMMLQKTWNQRKIIMLHREIDNIKKLKQQLSPIEAPNKETQENDIKNNISSQQTDQNEKTDTIKNDVEAKEYLRNCLRGELMELYERSKKKTISLDIINSEVYQTLQKMSENNQSLKEDDELWEKIRETVLKSSPHFMSNLNLLTGGKLTSIDIKTALLLKFGLTAKQLSILFVKSNGAIISRRENLSVKIFDKKIGVAVIDGIIRLL